jgi:hypothetical protein
MGILENAAEVDRLYVVHDKIEAEGYAEPDQTLKRQARTACNDVTARIWTMFEGMACSIPSTTDEALALAVLLRSQTDGSVFLEHDGEARKRAERIINNLVVGLSRCKSADLPKWFEGHITAAENGDGTGPADGAAGDSE